MILSVSASHEDAVTKYAWMKYKGSRGKEVSQRTHKRMIREGDTFGILPLRNGGRYTLIFADMPHVDFPLDKTTGLFLMERSTKLRKVPDVVQRDSRTKTAGARTMQRQINRVQFDAARFAPKSVKAEAVYGINFDNYQWRMVPSMEYPVKTSKGMIKLYKNDMIGVRFLRQGKGGVVINTEGLYVKVDDSQFDLIVHDTNILPFNDWPKGEIDVDTVKAYRKQVRRHRKRSQLEEEEAVRLANNAKVLEQKQQRKELQKQARKTAAERAAEMRDLRNKVKSGEIEAPKAEVRTVYEDGIDKRGKRVKIIEHEELDDAIEEVEVEVDLDFDEQKLEDVLSRSPFAGDMFNIEDSIGSLFGGDDSQDHEEPALDLSDIDEPEDDEEDVAPSKVRAKVKGKKPAEALPKEEEEDTSDTDDEEDPDAEEDPDDSDPDTDDSEDGSDESDGSDDESVDDADADDEGADSEGEDDEQSDDDADADATDAVDEAGAEEDQDSDVAAAEDEAKETAKKIAAANQSTPSARAEEAEEGDVLQFKADAKLKRDWLVVRVSTHNSSDNIVIYTLYDITNSPDEVRQVRVNRARKQNLFDYAEHVKDMAPKLFNRVYDMVEDFPVNKDPIAS
ncbi:hypothetical protein pEaSNUABM35_00146 [Erwinia phage pEa_SNUABM_35]|uniref:KTSC and Metallopeptidase-like N-terminal fusion domain-containing protein n=1 Tax=Erwinia phage pEa_SNUABM_35 TaxID=2869557 RepID=A0AAE7XR23_9CAUD|nr:hypothetical protein MPK65_gp146 [Erwinia phage pEa_SNUABM_35]QZE60063.1 hypothetical protein pEaSNUABM35_00146 [Erwinia phage pEa_SNUABM_35]QZE60399.1 hypothetical protein pEaSNUABM36_00146 [Erwinia phage pEa_SNUABM_36]